MTDLSNFRMIHIIHHPNLTFDKKHNLMISGADEAVVAMWSRRSFATRMSSLILNVIQRT